MFLFRKSKKKHSTGVDGATVSLKENIRVIQKREEHLLECVRNELSTAKSLVDKDRRSKSSSFSRFLIDSGNYAKSIIPEAALALKKKKHYEKEIERLSGTRFALEQQVLALEGASLNVETLNSLRSGAATLATLHKKVDAGSIDEAMDEVREQLDLANEISEAIAQPFSTGAEEGISDELDELQQEVLNERLLDDGLTAAPQAAVPDRKEKILGPTPVFPEVEKAPFASAPSSGAEIDDQAELEELRASMAT